MELYSAFYRGHGVRTLAQMTDPPIDSTTSLALPKNSIVHHLSVDDVGMGPEPEGLLYKNYAGRKLVEHIDALVSSEGNPRQNRSAYPNRLAKDYHRRYRTMRPLHDFNKSLRDERTLVVENYAHLNQLYIYMRSVFAQYYKWHNIYRTLAANFEKRCADNSREHFILMDLPKQLPAPAILKKASGPVKNLDRNLLEGIAKPQMMFILELWKLLGPSKEESVFNIISPEHYARMNIVWVESGHWFVFNLGRILELEEDELTDDIEGSTQLQRRFLRMLMVLFERRTQSNPIVESADDDPSSKKPAEKDTAAKPKLDEADIDADLAQLDELAKKAEEKAQEPVVQEPLTPSEAIIARCDQMAEEGLISAAEYRRFTKLVEKSKSLPNPYGKGTLAEFSDIKPEDVTIDPEQVKIPKIKGVTDESMLVSSLKAMDSQYIKNVLTKDITNAAMAVQNAGVIVTEYNVETVEDAANHYQIVTMKLNPVDGDPSTVRFRLPVVDENGEFRVNDVKYRMRKQRADKPIRKTAPDTVALTSYYAKVFVTRSEKSVVNYPKWLLNQLVEMGLDPANKKITNLKHTKTFLSKVKLPRIYTILSQRVREFTVDGKYRIYVDYARREEVFGKELVAQYEKDGGFVFAGMAGNNPILIDENNAFYVVENKSLTVLGRIEELVGLDATKAPVEIAEFSLFSRSVPVAIALGHRYGLTRLMQVLGVRPRRIPTGTRVNQTDGEYSIRFSDETLVFSKDDHKAMLILAGFNRYHRSIKRYSVDAFDDREVYANIMEDNGMRVGFIRELELAMEMFVDPITRELLVDMEEPTTLDGLLIRACELLLIDWHPDETDMEYMRIRGYERMAGAVYAEMVRSIRRYRSRGVGKAAKIELNPEAVWQAVNQDPSMSQVEESNPIQNLKEQELVTYMGTGGRSARSMVKHTRAFHESDMGVISEATVDSGSVGVNAYLTANPQFESLRGTTKNYDPKSTGNSSMISTSALLAPVADHDDPKRVNISSLA